MTETLAPPAADASVEVDSPAEAFPTVPERVRAWGRRVNTRLTDDPGAAAEAAVSLVAVVLGTALVLATLHPSRLWQDTTPTGGDMGAHVWGPRYLIDHLLPNFRLSGWSPDWYNGFPAYQFYMVVPALMIVGLHVGLVWYLAIPVLALLAAAAYQVWSRPSLFPYRLLATGTALALGVLAVGVPYNRSFKIVTALGLLGVPLACWALAKLADLPFPIPPLASVAGVVFIYNREPLFNNTGNIIGGNFQSTMAGEFAFSISLTLAILYLGVACRGLRTGRHRALAAVLFALAGLCHLIPAFFVLGCTAALFLVHPDRARFKWLATMVPVAGLLTAFWVVPFALRAPFVNDMGWERLPAPGANLSPEAAKLAGNQESVTYYLFPLGLRWLMWAAVIGVVVSVIRRYSVGMVLALAWVGVMVAFTWLPQARLWNARLLPFLYLSVALLAAIAAGELIRVAGSLASGRVDRPLRAVSVGASSVVVLGALLYAALPLSNVLPSVIERKPVTVSRGTGTETVTESALKLPFGVRMFHTTAVNPVAGWADWNYKGLELKPEQPAGCADAGSTVACTTGGWLEYRALVQTMAELGRSPQHGCGRALWEYDQDRTNGYGTPMAPMLLPYWTGGCIGSQEGLYFESSTTVPYHFLMQSELSAKPSQPQRDLPYPGFDMDAGVRHLQMMGVRYYLAVSSQAVSAAAAHPDLEEVAVSGPWHVYEVADAPLVAAMPYEPVVADDMGQGQHDWLPMASAWFLHPDALDVPMAAEGPDEWERVDAPAVPHDWRRLVRWARDQVGATGPIDTVPDLPRTALPEVEVTDVEQTNDGISFDVSKVGVPVLVRTSYFPNWEVTGADGPYRVTPNLMVVVPTSEHVSLHYGRTGVDLLGAGLSVIGLVGLVLLARSGPIEVSPYRAGRVSAWIDRKVTIEPGPAVIADGPEAVPPSVEAPWVEPPSPEPPSVEPSRPDGSV